MTHLDIELIKLKQEPIEMLSLMISQAFK